MVGYVPCNQNLVQSDPVEKEGPAVSAYKRKECVPVCPFGNCSGQLKLQMMTLFHSAETLLFLFQANQRFYYWTLVRVCTYVLVVAFSSCSKENYSRTSVWLCLCVPALLLQAFIDIFGLEEDKGIYTLYMCVVCTWSEEASVW